MEAISTENSEAPAAISVRETVIFPDEALVILKYPSSASLFTKDEINCIYLPPNSSQPQLQLSPAAVDFDKENHQIVRCQLPPRGTILSLAVKHNGNLAAGPMYRWDSLAYEAVIDGRDNTTLLFVKGLNLLWGEVADPSMFKCIYGSDLSNPRFVLWGDAVSAAQEIVRCRTPLSILNGSQRFDSFKVSVRVVGGETVNSIARLKHEWSPKVVGGSKQHKMCVCTMLRNQARFLQEWIVYHGRVGVQRWFIYDNNSDDNIEGVVEALVGGDYNVSRHLWPWIKTQEAGFAHCAMRARDSCEWVGFIDVDEFFHLPRGRQSLYEVVEKEPSDEVGEIRVSCHSFGPSGLNKVPEKGVMAGYTCRMGAPERHKSIIRPEGLNSSLMNVVHHFHLKSGLKHVDMKSSALVINHYKYQVWEVFKEKFHRRVAAYVSDWQEERNLDSKDRAPGLGTKPVEPADWSRRFCEVNDTGLRNRVLETFTDPQTGYLPWEDQPHESLT
ncbi:C3H4 type zinc finger protein [Perilla frutescens var. hirtella]|uniref:Glycosyltransferase family 92 protein n=1 Tax=Perilla frutescens var. hirtella TaxID=608512 RepID=A0AAD4P1L3_PERFH|nr:C3H4 type zinc finger protein [Perilla frutescens var. hirtella]